MITVAVVVGVVRLVLLLIVFVVRQARCTCRVRRGKSEGRERKVVVKDVLVARIVVGHPVV
jgi:hypothetical protein